MGQLKLAAEVEQLVPARLVQGGYKEMSSILKVHKNDNFFGFDFEFCTISLLVMQK